MSVLKKTCLQTFQKQQVGNSGFDFDHFQVSKFNCMVVENLLNVCISMMGEKSLQKNFKDPNTKNINDIYKNERGCTCCCCISCLFKKSLQKSLKQQPFKRFAQTHRSSWYRVNYSTWFEQFAHVFGKQVAGLWNYVGEFSPTPQRPHLKKLSDRMVSEKPSPPNHRYTTSKQ